MNPLLAILDPVAYVVIFVVVLIFGRVAFLATRQRLDQRRIERKLDALLQHHGIVLPTGLSPEVQQLARDPKRRIAAIKLHREQTGASLLEAKNAVEDFCGS
jgi:preprotein translocase subunit YajC